MYVNYFTLLLIIIILKNINEKIYCVENDCYNI